MNLAPAEPGLILAAPGLDLDATLTSGQSFSWSRARDGHWRGWIAGRPCAVFKEGETLHVAGTGITAADASRYFGLGVALPEIFVTFPADPWLDRARAFAPGLRLLRQDPWETLCNFICSALKQIVQIEQINRELRRAFGEKIGDDLHAFPSPVRLAAATEAELRQCRLGFRARHLYVAARQIAAGEISLEQVATLPTPAACAELQRLRGVGAKVANCILLFAYDRIEAFPIDIWVERVLRRLYFKNRRVSHDKMSRFAERHFGPYRGYAQQFLFHWIRTDPTALPPLPRAKKMPKKKAA